MQNDFHYDVAIVGGGPSGATLGTLLKKYRPETTVAILERDCQNRRLNKANPDGNR